MPQRLAHIVHGLQRTGSLVRDVLFTQAERDAISDEQNACISNICGQQRGAGAARLVIQQRIDGSRTTLAASNAALACVRSCMRAWVCQALWFTCHLPAMHIPQPRHLLPCGPATAASMAGCCCGHCLLLLFLTKAQEAL